jgi:DNA polymerase-3 subunit alpha
MRKYLKIHYHIEDLIAMNALASRSMNYIRNILTGSMEEKSVVSASAHWYSGTYGIMVYQNGYGGCRVMAGYTLGAADLLRRAMGKKIREEMQKQRSVFVDGAKSKGLDEKAAEEVFTIMEKFAEYGFNRSHSAGYAIIAYQTAYLKANYTAEFMAATLSNYNGSIENIQFYLDETRRFKIKTLGPDINESHIKFVANKKRDSFSLNAIKGIGEAAVAAIIEEHEKWLVQKHI